MDIDSVRVEGLARKKGYVTREQVQEALMMQALEASAHNRVVPLRRILVENDYLSPEQLEQLESERLDLLRDGFGKDMPDEVRRYARDRDNFTDRFVRLTPLGRGGMGEVWKAYDVLLKRFVAIKFIQHADNVPMILREAQTLASLRHPNIVEVHETGDDYIVMQYVAGETLDKGKRPLRENLEIFRDVASAIHFAHEQGVIHRDIKPQNVMTEKRDGTTHVYVMDFGIARRLDEFTSRTTSVIGTPSYMAPEQLRGPRDAVDARSDVYSLGALLYTMLAGRPPVLAESLGDLLKEIETVDPIPPSQANPEVPKELDLPVLKALEKDKSLRFQSAKEFADEIGRFLRGEPLTCARPGIFHRASRKLRRHWRAALTAALVLLGIGAGAFGAYFVTKGRGEKPPQPPAATLPAGKEIPAKQVVAPAQQTVLPPEKQTLRRADVQTGKGPKQGEDPKVKEDEKPPQGPK